MAAGALALGSFASRAQYYELANQLPRLITPALSGSMNYKGFVELTGVGGLGTNRANFVGLSTSQGFRYSSWFFMGVGAGVDIARSSLTDDSPAFDQRPDWGTRSLAQTRVLVPVFSDFRFTLGSPTAIGGYIDLKMGAAWLMGSRSLMLSEGYLSTATQFLLQPSVGVRIPVSNNGNQAVNIGLTYRLLTANRNYSWSGGSSTLNNIGATIGFEW